MSTAVDRAPELMRRGLAQPSRRSKASKALLACGIGSSVAYVAANVAGALRGDGYSSVNQSVSELTPIDVPSRPVALPLFVASDVLATTLQIMGAMGFAAAAFGKRFRRYSVASLVTMLVAGGLTGRQKNAVAANLPTPWNGSYERTSIGVYLLWMAVLAAVLLRASGHAQPRGPAG